MEENKSNLYRCSVLTIQSKQMEDCTDASMLTLYNVKACGVPGAEYKDKTELGPFKQLTMRTNFEEVDIQWLQSDTLRISAQAKDKQIKLVCFEDKPCICIVNKD